MIKKDKKVSVNALQQENRTLKGQFNIMQEEVEKLKEEKERYQEEAEDLKEELDYANRNVKTLEARLDEKNREMEMRLAIMGNKATKETLIEERQDLVNIIMALITEQDPRLNRDLDRRP